MFFKNFLRRNISELQKNNPKIIFKKIFTFIKMVFSVPFYGVGFLILPILYLIRPLYLVRFTNLPSNRIGHFAANTELYCCERDLKINTPKQPYLDIFFCNDIANNYLAKMWKRKLFILPSLILAPSFYLNNFFCKFFESCKLHTFEVGTTGCRDINLLFNQTRPHLSFTKDEEKYGQKYLDKFGLNVNSKFICLIVRDSGYLAEYQYRDWSYHDYRNSDIDSFILACEALTKKGYHVFRMGTKVLKKLKSSNSKIIDYANSNDRTEFLDIYLGAKCKFCLTTATGYDNIPFVFRKPLAALWVPLADIATYGKNHIHITKHHYSLKKKRKLSMAEIFENGLDSLNEKDHFKSKGIILQESTEEEIRDLAIEMAERLEGSWKDEEEDIELQKKFLNKFKYLVEKKKETSIKHSKIVSRFGSKFLKQNNFFLD